MNIEIRYFDDCPNWETTSALVEELIVDLGLDASVKTLRVATPEAAQKLRFRGSPTVMVDGVDPFANPDAPVGLSCRIYRTETGLARSPSEAQLRAVLSGG